MRFVPARLALFIGLVTAGVVVAMPPARAQLIAGPGMRSKPAPAKPGPTPPPALPGAQTDADLVTPTDKIPTDMPPTDALFDAINRGDITSARDAIARGADLNGHNLLGMSPMELAVDLGRNNIAFLLLSLRGERRATPAAKTTTAAEAAGKPPAVAPRAARVERTAARPTRLPPVKAPQAPQLFAGDGGAPIPSAGFLGFDPDRTPAPKAR